jgi:hypothetical protein
MSLDIGDAVGEGFSRSVARNALLLAVAFAVVALLTLVAQQTLNFVTLERTLEFYQEMPADERRELGVSDQDVAALKEQNRLAARYLVLALPIPPWAATALFVAVAVLAEYASIVAVRLFATDETERLPGEFARRNAALATLNGFVGGVVVWGIVGVGTLLFVVPGLFLAVALYFVRQEIALHDKNFVQAMADSWRLTKGDRLAVFGVLLVATVVTNLWYLLTPLFFVVPPALAAVLVAAAMGYFGLVGVAIVTRAYVQLEATDAEAEETDDPYDAALGPDDIPR